jgi:hypothetical protein
VRWRNGTEAQQRVELLAADVQAGVGRPLLAHRHAVGRAQLLHLGLVHQPGVVVLVAGERQAVALHGVGDEAARAVVVHAAERVEHGLQVVAAEVGHQLVEGAVVVAVQDRADGGVAAEVALQVRAPGGAALEGERAVEVVRAGVDPVAQGLAAGPGEGGLQPLAVLDGDDLPADRGEELLDLREQALRGRRGPGSAGCSRSPTRRS